MTTRMERLVQVVEDTLAKGGATFTHEGEQITEGYAVARGNTKMVRRSELDPAWLGRWTDDLNELQGHEVFGTWVDSEDPDWVYVESARVYPRDDIAAAVAEATNELAYFDLNNGREVRL